MRIKQLDVLRAVAVLLVLGRHSEYRSLLTDYWRRIGWGGVDLFFVLSGFLVSGLLFRELQQSQQSNIGRFLFRRGMKIYPSFYVLTAVTLLISGVHAAGGLLRILAECLFLQNYARGIQIHTWSLAIEEHFYFALALAIWIMARRHWVGLIPWLFLAVAGTSLGLRLLSLALHGANQWAMVLPTHMRMDGLCFGVLLSYVRWYRPHFFASVSGSRLLPVFGLAALAPWLLFSLDTSAFLMTVGLTLNYLGFGALLLWALARPAHRWMGPVAFVGTYSYSIYVWHVGVQNWCLPLLHLNPATFAGFLTYVVAAVAAGIAAAKLIEFPMLALRDRIAADRSTAPVPSPSLSATA